MSDRVGQLLGNYRLIRLLGKGGFAEVYLGQHLYLDTLAAVKVIRQPLQNEFIEKFQDEARIIADLVHPHIVRVLDFGLDEKEQVPFLVMDYAHNGSLRQRHPRGTALPLDLIVEYVKQIADALHYVHSQRYSDNRRLVHRDVKPENLLFGRNDEILLSDFGIAIITQTTDPKDSQRPAGTIAYTAPEQLQGKSHRASDQYSLGIIVYEWLTGTCPFTGSVTEVAYQHIKASPAPLRTHVPTLAPAVEEVVLKALAKKIGERFPGVQEFAIAFAQAALSSKQIGPFQLPVRTQGPDFTYDSHSSKPTERTISTYYVHTAPVKTLAWSFDGQHIASAGDDGILHIWDATSGRNILTYAGHKSGVNTLAWTPLPQKQLIASGSEDGIVQIWDATTGETLFTYIGHASSVTALAWSPDGKYIASVSQDKTVQVWNETSRNIYHGHRSDIVAVIWSPESASFATGALDGTIMIWDVATNSISSSFHYLDRVTALAWSPDGCYIASAGAKARVLQVSTKQLIVTYRAHKHFINAIAWSPDGQYIATASRTVQIWLATSAEHRFTYRNHTKAIHAIAWAPDGQRIASGSADHTVRVWQMDSLQLPDRHTKGKKDA